MKEDFLHYLWKFKKFDTSNLYTTNQESITLIHSGNYLQLSGPDFFNAQMLIGQQQWAGNVEIHLKSSDWYHHHHEKDEAYENVILHVVWQHDTEIFRQDNTEIPVLELKKYVSKEVLDQYDALIQPKSWIFCEKDLASIDQFVFKNWQERLFFERLESKAKPIDDLVIQTQSDWDAILFCMLAKNFGLNTNGEIFLKIATAIPFAVIRKESFEVENIEALLFGTAGLLTDEKQDTYFANLKSRYQYLTHKYQLTKSVYDSVQFFKHRPDNFPTIRLSQLAQLYGVQQQLFSKIIAAVSVKQLYDIFQVSVSHYWKTHYQFDKVSPKQNKGLSKAFIDLIVINTVVPIQFAYARSQGIDPTESTVQLLQQIAAETNAVIHKFAFFGRQACNAFESQALLQLKNEYCNKSKCLSCVIGMELLKSNPIKV
ncbi:MAG: DUF2851 family protein [Burkholderiales bacterium]|nr:DUF2851 family protein [Flavobacterium sp.]